MTNRPSLSTATLMGDICGVPSLRSVASTALELPRTNSRAWSRSIGLLSAVAGAVGRGLLAVAAGLHAAPAARPVAGRIEEHVPTVRARACLEPGPLAGRAERECL